MATKKTGSGAKSKPSGKKSKAIDLTRAYAALPKSAATTPPPIPVKQLVHEARFVARAAQAHARKLDAVDGWDRDHRKTLTLRADELDAKEASWLLVRSRSGAAAIRKLRIEAERLRSELVAACRFFLRSDPAVQAALDSIQEGTGLADLIGDLGELRALCTAHRAALATAKLPGGIGGALARTSELATGLSDASSAEALDPTAKQALADRNRAAALVVQSLSEVRAAARYALRGDPDALAHYRGEYRIRKNAKSRARSAAPTPAPGGGNTPTA